MLRNRERELGYLDTRYASDRAELVILYGRRRVGKTTLVHHWTQDKPHLFFFATQDDNATLLRRFSHLSRQAAGESPDPAFTYPDWETALRTLGHQARQHRFVVVIDEFPPHYLFTLQEMGLVTVQQPLERIGGRQRWARYHLQDPFLRFWQHFVAPRQAELEIGHGQETLWHEIRLQMPQVVAPVWERIACWHLLRCAGQGGLPPVAEVGSWWSSQVQIDVVGVDRHGRSVVLGEARWRQEPFTRRDLERLMERGQRWLRGSDAHWDVHYAVYARNPAPGLQALAEQERNVHLFTPSDVVGRS